MSRFDVVEKSIPQILGALDAGETTSVDLVCAYLNRIAYYDRTGLCLQAVPIINPNCLEEAAASDARRREGKAGPLEGVPFTVKDSYKVEGLTVASGSPALQNLVANEDAAAVALLRAAGAVLLGKTNMPPMAAGGVQPGVYGYARSPYNPEYITAAYGSGSSNGSGTATAASMCAFGMAEETVSSGRSPASNNALVAFTPSRGMLSIRGNWPLRPSCDVVVPHTRTMEDLLLLLDVLAVADERSDGDFWREQSAVELPSPDAVFEHPIARPRPERLDGVRFGVPKMYIGEDTELLIPPVISACVRALWDRAADDLRALGAEVVEVDFPVVSNYEEDRPGAEGPAARGLVPESWRGLEGGPVTALAFDRFLRANGDPALNTWADVDGDTVFPTEDAPVPVWITRARGGFDFQRLAELVKQGLPGTFDEIPELAHMLRGLEEMRKQDLEDWMAELGLDAVVFPAAGDVGRDDLFSRPESLAHASLNGVVYSNGNRVLRHLGIPTVTVPMGGMGDSQMPVGLTFAGAAYSDDTLLDYGWAYEQATHRRDAAYLTPTIPSNQIEAGEGGVPHASVHVSVPAAQIEHSVAVRQGERAWEITVTVPAAADHDEETSVWVDGHQLMRDAQDATVFRGKVSLSRERVNDELMVLVKIGSGAATLSYEPLPGA